MFRSRKALMGLMVVLLSAPVAALHPASATPVDEGDATTTRAVLRVSQTEAMPGERLALVAGPPRTRAFRRLPVRVQRRAVLVLQRRISGRWRTVAKRRLRTNRVRYAFKTPLTARGSLVFRTVARSQGHAYRAATVRLPVQVPRLALRPEQAVAGSQTTWEATFSPARSGRRVRLQEHVDGAWQDTGLTARADSEGRASFTTTTPRLPRWYRVVAGAYRGAPGFGGDATRTVLEREPVVVAHRAGAGLAPEQTLAAVRRARDLGVAAMEVDVQLSKDQVPVIVHDATLARTTNVEEVFPDRAPWNVSDFTLAEIKRLDAGSWFDARFAGERIPTLDEVISQLGSADLVLEVKSPRMAGNLAISDVLARELASGRLGDLASADRLTVSSFDVGWLESFAKAHPRVPVGVLWFFAPTVAQLDAWSTWAEEVHLRHQSIDRTAIEAARARGLASSVWTVNQRADLEQVALWGPDRIITDFPDQLMEIVAPPQPRG